LTWPRQNHAIGNITPGLIRKVAKDTLFVMGRNIYQSATGNSNSAVAFIRDFNGKTEGAPAVNRKALLDGMLFEIFFDKSGQLRDDPKFRCFNDVFELQRFATLKGSFDFIAACLLPYAGRYYAIPGWQFQARKCRYRGQCQGRSTLIKSRCMQGCDQG